MMKAISLQLLCCVLVLIIIAWAIPCIGENISFKTDDDSVVNMSGAMKKPETAYPGDSLLRYTIEQSLSPVSMFFEFQFLGRTGEKTFDVDYNLKVITKTSEGALERGVVDRLSYYFVKGDLVPVQRGGFPGCSEDDIIYLKLLAFKGNEFKYQIILSDCIKRYIK